MKDDISIPNLGTPPTEYDPSAFARIIRTIETHLTALQSVGPIRVHRINIVDVPTSATGLRSGDIWSDAGTLKIVA